MPQVPGGLAGQSRRVGGGDHEPGGAVRPHEPSGLSAAHHVAVWPSRKGPAQLARHQTADHATLADALLADLLPPDGVTEDTAPVFVRL
ncbi:hypothetical protein OG735_02085 [Streptomyces sp. NBC_01210]|nr:hypothetical protein OG735_02085 [Streptomyces sp. NBC_01210]